MEVSQRFCGRESDRVTKRECVSEGERERKRGTERESERECVFVCVCLCVRAAVDVCTWLARISRRERECV